MKKIVRGILVLAALTLALGACSSKSKSSGVYDVEDGQGLSEYDLNSQQAARFGDGNIPTAEGEGMFRDVFFGYDSSEVDDRGRQAIEYNVQVLRSNPNVNIQLEGHTDERGTAEYNMALGSRRAKAVKDLLLSYGLSPSKLETISYGEEVPLDPGNNESAFAKNRRVHFSGFQENSQGTY